MKHLVRSVCVVLLVVSFGGCSIRDLFTEPTPPPTEELPTVTQTEEGIIASEGVIVPVRSLVLRAAAPGVITEVAVAEGDRVATDAQLARFDATDAEVAIRQAEAGLLAAQARLDLAVAAARPEEIAALEGSLAAAEAALAQSVAERDLQASGSTSADLLDAQTALVTAETTFSRADDDHNETMKCYDVTLPDGSPGQTCPLLGTFEEQARYQMQAAQAALAAEQARYRALENTTRGDLTVSQAAVSAQAARSDALKAQMALATAGPRAEERAVAEAGVRQAEAVLARATAQLALSVLEAPFAGTITALSVQTGDSIAAGDALMTLATLDHLQVKTKDLTELDVVKVVEGQSAVITLDAMPGAPLQGHVARIDPQSEDYMGDVVYTVVIEFDEMPPTWLRWGMTGLIQIITDESLVESAQDTKADSSVMPTGAAVAEATAEPERWSAVRFVVGGRVDNVEVAVGDRVEAGTALVHLDRTDAMLAVQEATTAIARVEAELALKRAGPRAEEVAAAEAKLQAAAGDLDKAIAQRNQLLGGGAEAERAVVEAHLQTAWAERQRALVEITWAEEGDDQAKKNAAHEQLRLAELKIQAAETRLAILPAMAAAQLRVADAGVASAQAQVDIAMAELALIQAGPTDEEVAMAAAEVEIAEANLAAAEVALGRHTLVAPFSGTVTHVAIDTGDPVGPGQMVLALIDQGPLQLRTIDLNELDVVRLEAGQPVQVRVDALHDRVYSGHIVHISHQSVDFRGDITYPMVVSLDEAVPELRWGMRAVVTIEPVTVGSSGGVAAQP